MTIAMMAMLIMTIAMVAMTMAPIRQHTNSHIVSNLKEILIVNVIAGVRAI